MSLDPHRASVVVDLLESATRAGALEKQEAAAILSSWIEEQKQGRSDASSPDTESEPSQTPPSSSAALESTTMTIKTTTMTTTAAQSQTPAQLPGSPAVAASHSVISFSDAAAPLTPSSIRRMSRQPLAGLHGSMPSTPTPSYQFFLPQQPSTPPPPTNVMPSPVNTATSVGRHFQQQKQQQQSRCQQRQRSRRSGEPMRSLLHVFAACAIGNRGDDSGESDPGCSTDCGHTAPLHHRFYLDPPPLPPLPPPSPMSSPLSPLAEPLTRPASSGGDPQTYALYDLTGEGQHTYCYIDEADLVDCLPAAATASAKSAPDHSMVAASPSDTSDSGVYDSGLRVETTAAAEATQD